MKIKIANIEQDVSIQCRARIDTATVDDYAERMTEGDVFPPVVLFGTKEKCWIGDGWHRIMAATQIGAVDIEAELKAGNRTDALKFALSANATNALQRSNADKRRCVEIALKEFPNLSSRAIAEMCGVSHMTVQRMMPEQLEYCSSSTRLGRDGKERHLPQPRDPAQEPEGKEDKPETKRARPCFGMKHARVAIMALEQIEKNDDERFAAMDHVEHWISDWRERHQEKEGGAAA